MTSENNVPVEWSAEGLLDEIHKLNGTMEDRSLAFILGAGASITSGIPAGGDLAQTWLKDIHLRQCLSHHNMELEAWAADKLQAPDFRLSDAATYYAKIFELRFGGDPKSGYAALEAVMEDAEPGLGYSILAKVLAETRHKVVVTTNFDNLVADALAIHALQHPLIVGHESLTGFVRSRLPRPLVAKIHRDLHLHPINDQNGVDTLEKGWEEALQVLFKDYTPLVIGYGGNDGSLMKFLRNLPQGHIPGRLFWCYREGSRPGTQILETIAHHNGVLVAIAGFDEFMVQLAAKLFDDFELTSIAQSIEELGKERAKRYQAQADKLLEQLARANTSSSSSTTDNARQSISEASHDESKWWTWELRAQAEIQPEKRDAIYRQALAKLPNSPELTGNYAGFLTDIRQDHDAAEVLYKRVLELDPKDADYTGNYANFLTNIRQDHDAAEALYKRALELDPKHANNTGNYAGFLTDIRQDHDAAEVLYKRVLELDPKDTNHTGNYAGFLTDIRQAYDAAEALYKRALELDPKHAYNTGNYANFLTNIRQDHDAAEVLYKRALEFDPKHAYNTGNYANFLTNIRQEHDAAEVLYKRALELNPKHAYNTGNYANFLTNIRQEHDAAEVLYKRALELNPEHAYNTGNYAIFMHTIRKDYDAAELLYQRAIKLDSDDVNSTANYAGLLLTRQQFTQAQAMACQALQIGTIEPSQAVAESLYYLALIAYRDDSNSFPAESCLKGLLANGFERGEWDLVPMIDAIRPFRSETDEAYFVALAAAIVDADHVADLEQFERWRNLTVLPLEQMASLYPPPSIETQ